MTSRWLPPWEIGVHLPVPGDVFHVFLCFLCCPFANEMSLMRSGTQLSQFLKVFRPTLVEDNVLITYMQFLWELHGNFGCHDNRSWKNWKDISYDTTWAIFNEISYLAFIRCFYKIWQKQVMI